MWNCFVFVVIDFRFNYGAFPDLTRKKEAKKKSIEKTPYWIVKVYLFIV